MEIRAERQDPLFVFDEDSNRSWRRTEKQVHDYTVATSVAYIQKKVDKHFAL